MATTSSAAASTPAIMNPYSKAATNFRKEQQRQLLSSQATNQAAATMGIQSQRREGAVKKRKKTGY